MYNKKLVLARSEFQRWVQFLEQARLAPNDSSALKKKLDDWLVRDCHRILPLFKELLEDLLDDFDVNDCYHIAYNLFFAIAYNIARGNIQERYLLEREDEIRAIETAFASMKLSITELLEFAKGCAGRSPGNGSL